MQIPRYNYIVVGALGRMMKGRTANMEIKKALHGSIIVPTLTYASGIWAWNEGQISRIQAVEMSYLRGACGLNRLDGESNESMCGKFDMSFKRVNCGMMEVVKRNTQVVWPLRENGRR